MSTNSSLIIGLLSQCDKLARTGLTDENLPSKSRAQLDDIHVRIKVWANEMGAFSQGDQSISYRLQVDPDGAELLLIMLKKLTDRIWLMATSQDYHEKGNAGGGSPDQVHPTEFKAQLGETRSLRSVSSGSTLSIDSNVESETVDGVRQPKRKILQQSAISEANDIIDQLYRLSPIFYDPEQEENANVRKFIATNRAEVTIKDKIEDVTDSAESWLNYHCANKISEKLRDRLVKAAVFRRVKLVFRQQHSHALRFADLAQASTEQIESAALHRQWL
ncbi:hypothetical protein QBC38DRAFT_121470 [Podospora fimiseda]|uniref:Uncharacterized protein n=1 Tax=Podospora fimiseda TaxID=252190 RepID=A0AAN6YN92_9PEZI|nr:hypothetical protein QBC38DRAFT_121470 [Podospora fimiseda]